MKVLIFGAHGMLGTDLVEVFSDAHPTGLGQNECDITHTEDVEYHVQDVHPSIIINAAAYANVDGAEEEEELATRVNGEAVGILARAAKSVGATLVHYSTDYVFDGKSEQGYIEDDPVNPISAYGRSKAEGERQLRANTDAFYVLRTSWLYGKNGKNFVETMLTVGPKKGELNVVNDQHGKPTWTHDLALQTRFLLEHANRYSHGIYHATNENQTTWYDFAQMIFKIKGLNVTVHPVPTSESPRPAKRPMYSSLQNTKMPPMRAWESALEEYLRI